MSLTLGLVAGWLISRAWDELSWRRDERDAEIRLRCVLAAQRAEAATADAFARTLEEIGALPVADPWDGAGA